MTKKEVKNIIKNIHKELKKEYDVTIRELKDIEKDDLYYQYIIGIPNGIFNDEYTLSINKNNGYCIVHYTSTFTSISIRNLENSLNVGKKIETLYNKFKEQ